MWGFSPGNLGPGFHPEFHEYSHPPKDLTHRLLLTDPHIAEATVPDRHMQSPHPNYFQTCQTRKKNYFRKNSEVGALQM